MWQIEQPGNKAQQINRPQQVKREKCQRFAQNNPEGTTPVYPRTYKLMKTVFLPSCSCRHSDAEKQSLMNDQYKNSRH